MFGKPRFGRWILDHFPSAKLQRAKNIADTLWFNAERLVTERETALSDTPKGNNEQIHMSTLSLLSKSQPLGSRKNLADYRHSPGKHDRQRRTAHKSR